MKGPEGPLWGLWIDFCESIQGMLEIDPMIIVFGVGLLVLAAIGSQF